MEFGKKYGMYIALAVVLGMIPLYSWQEARTFISGIVDIVIGPFAALGLPFFALVLILARKNSRSSTSCSVKHSAPAMRKPSRRCRRASRQ